MPPIPLLLPLPLLKVGNGVPLDSVGAMVGGKVRKTKLGGLEGVLEGFLDGEADGNLEGETDGAFDTVGAADGDTDGRVEGLTDIDGC